jgi:hypothetical protein
VVHGNERAIANSDSVAPSTVRRERIVAAYSNDVVSYIPSQRVLQESGYESVDGVIYYGTTPALMMSRSNPAAFRTRRMPPKIGRQVYCKYVRPARNSSRYFTAMVTPAWLAAVPTVSTTGALPGEMLDGTVRFNCIKPSTNVGAAP